MRVKTFIRQLTQSIFEFNRDMQQPCEIKRITAHTLDNASSQFERSTPHEYNEFHTVVGTNRFKYEVQFEFESHQIFDFDHVTLNGLSFHRKDLIEYIEKRKKEGSKFKVIREIVNGALSISPRLVEIDRSGNEYVGVENMFFEVMLSK